MQWDPANNRQLGDLETSNVADAEDQMKEVRGRYRIVVQAETGQSRSRLTKYISIWCIYEACWRGTDT